MKPGFTISGVDHFTQADDVAAEMALGLGAGAASIGRKAVDVAGDLAGYLARDQRPRGASRPRVRGALLIPVAVAPPLLTARQVDLVHAGHDVAARLLVAAEATLH